MRVQDPGKRRGRRPTRPDPDSGAIAFFADRLLRLKEEAGNPSYAEMSSTLGAAASKSSLAGAAQGRKLPSWETAWEFVRVLAVDRLGRDPGQTEREWRELWERAKAASSGGAAAGIQDEARAVGATNDSPHAPPATTAEGVTTAAAPPRPARRNRALVGGVITAVIVVIVVIGLTLPRPTADVERGDPRPSPATSATAGDDSRFVGDITYPDGSTVRPGSSFTKVWRIRNTGTVSWEGRRLARINTAPCRSPESVSVPPTAPGRTVDIEVRVQAPDKPGHCRIYWKMTDARGRELFPDKRPVFLDVRIAAS